MYLDQIRNGFLSKKRATKNELDEQWKQFGSRVSKLPPIPTSVEIAPANILKTSPSSNKGTPTIIDETTEEEEEEKEDSREAADDTLELVDHIESSLPRSYQGRGLLLLNVFKTHPEIKVTKSRIYVNDKPLPSSTINIILNLVGKYKLLKYNLIPLFQILAINVNDQLLRIIQNSEAKNILREARDLTRSFARQKTSTPIKKQLFDDPNVTEDDDDDTDATFQDAPSTTKKKKGSGIIIKWKNFI